MSCFFQFSTTSQWELIMLLGFQTKLLTHSPDFRCSASSPLPSMPTKILVPTRLHSWPFAGGSPAVCYLGSGWEHKSGLQLWGKTVFTILPYEVSSPNRDVLPASKASLIYFSSDLAKTVWHSTIKLYLATVRNLHVTAGYPDHFKGKLLLRRVLHGILCYQSNQRTRHLPVTPEVLLSIRPILQSCLSLRDFSMISAAFNLAFSASLRCSKFTYSGAHIFHQQFDLAESNPSAGCWPQSRHLLIDQQTSASQNTIHTVNTGFIWKFSLE